MQKETISVHEPNRSRSWRVAYLWLCSLAVFVAAVLTPNHNWDMIPYTAAAFERQGLSGDALRLATYQDVEDVVPPDVFAQLVQGEGYRGTIYSDSEALRQQLPFYKIRYVYVTLILVIGMVVGSFALATVLISALSGAVLVFLSGLVTLRLKSDAAFFAVPPVVIALGGLSVARFSTPDALAASIAALTFLLIYKGRFWAAMALIAVFPLVRTDFVILSFALSVYLYFRHTRMSVVAFSLSVAAYLLVNAYAQNYGHLVIFNFTLIHGPHPYVDEMPVSGAISDYLAAYARGLPKLVFSNAFYIGLPSVLLLAVLRKEAKDLAPVTHLFLISWFFVLVHFMLFPAAFMRTYFLLVWCGVVILAFLFDGWQRRRVA